MFPSLSERQGAPWHRRQFDCGRKNDYTDETNAGTGTTCKYQTHTEKQATRQQTPDLRILLHLRQEKQQCWSILLPTQCDLQRLVALLTSNCFKCWSSVSVLVHSTDKQCPTAKTCRVQNQYLKGSHFPINFPQTINASFVSFQQVAGTPHRRPAHTQHNLTTPDTGLLIWDESETWINNTVGCQQMWTKQLYKYPPAVTGLYYL